MSKRKLLLLDDAEEFRRNHLARLAKNKTVTKLFELNEITPDQFRQTLAALEDRRAQAREPKFGAFNNTCDLDDAAVLIVDYDLLAIKEAGFVTGENVAYLARCYSRCGIILGLNQFGDNTFDLTLRGHPESFADLNIGSKHLDCDGLWQDSWKEFRPWHWPLIPQAIESFESRIEDLRTAMDQPILSWLQFPPVVAQLLARDTTQFIAKSTSPAQTTFTQFVRESGNGLQGRKDRTSRECEIRIAAARIAKWLERLVLAGQDILVDAPHLAARYPSLLKGPKRDAAAFDRTASFAEEDKLAIKHEKLSAALFPKSAWLSRPAWFWPTVSALDSIDEVREPWKAKQPELAFCEDTSCFKPKAKCHEFVADLPSPFARRYAAKVPKVDYRPEVRFSL
jgi:hypothetical protein